MTYTSGSWGPLELLAGGNGTSANGVGTAAGFDTPASMEGSPDGSRLYILDQNGLRVIDLATNTVTTPVTDGYLYEDFLCVGPTTGRIYLARSADYPAPHEIISVDPATWAISVVYTVAPWFAGFDVNDDETKLYIAWNESTAAIRRVNIADSVVDYTTALTTVDPSASAWSIALDEASDRVYIGLMDDQAIVAVTASTGVQVTGSFQSFSNSDPYRLTCVAPGEVLSSYAQYSATAVHYMVDLVVGLDGDDLSEAIRVAVPPPTTIDSAGFPEDYPTADHSYWFPYGQCLINDDLYVSDAGDDLIWRAPAKAPTGALHEIYHLASVRTSAQGFSGGTLAGDQTTMAGGGINRIASSADGSEIYFTTTADVFKMEVDQDPPFIVRSRLFASDMGTFAIAVGPVSGQVFVYGRVAAYPATQGIVRIDPAYTGNPYVQPKSATYFTKVTNELCVFSGSNHGWGNGVVGMDFNTDETKLYVAVNEAPLSYVVCLDVATWTEDWRTAGPGSSSVIKDLAFNPSDGYIYAGFLGDGDSGLYRYSALGAAEGVRLNVADDVDDPGDSFWYGPYSVTYGNGAIHVWSRTDSDPRLFYRIEWPTRVGTVPNDLDDIPDPDQWSLGCAEWVEGHGWILVSGGRVFYSTKQPEDTYDRPEMRRIFGALPAWLGPTGHTHTDGGGVDATTDTDTARIADVSNLAISPDGSTAFYWDNAGFLVRKIDILTSQLTTVTTPPPPPGYAPPTGDMKFGKTSGQIWGTSNALYRTDPVSWVSTQMVTWTALGYPSPGLVTFDITEDESKIYFGIYAFGADARRIIRWDVATGTADYSIAIPNADELSGVLLDEDQDKLYVQITKAMDWGSDWWNNAYQPRIYRYTASTGAQDAGEIKRPEGARLGEMTLISPGVVAVSQNHVNEMYPLSRLWRVEWPDIVADMPNIKVASNGEGSLAWVPWRPVTHALLGKKIWVGSRGAIYEIGTNECPSYGYPYMVVGDQPHSYVPDPIPGEGAEGSNVARFESALISLAARPDDTKVYVFEYYADTNSVRVHTLDVAANTIDIGVILPVNTVPNTFFGDYSVGPVSGYIYYPKGNTFNYLDPANSFAKTEVISWVTNGYVINSAQFNSTETKMYVAARPVGTYAAPPVSFAHVQCYDVATWTLDWDVHLDVAGIPQSIDPSQPEQETIWTVTLDESLGLLYCMTVKETAEDSNLYITSIYTIAVSDGSRAGSTVYHTDFPKPEMLLESPGVVLVRKEQQPAHDNSKMHLFYRLTVATGAWGCSAPDDTNLPTNLQSIPFPSDFCTSYASRLVEGEPWGVYDYSVWRFSTAPTGPPPPVVIPDCEEYTGLERIFGLEVNDYAHADGGGVNATASTDTARLSWPIAFDATTNKSIVYVNDYWLSEAVSAIRKINVTTNQMTTVYEAASLFYCLKVGPVTGRIYINEGTALAYLDPTTFVKTEVLSSTLGITSFVLNEDESTVYLQSLVSGAVIICAYNTQDWTLLWDTEIPGSIATTPSLTLDGQWLYIADGINVRRITTIGGLDNDVVEIPGGAWSLSTLEEGAVAPGGMGLFDPALRLTPKIVWPDIECNFPLDMPTSWVPMAFLNMGSALWVLSGGGIYSMAHAGGVDPPPDDTGGGGGGDPEPPPDPDDQAPTHPVGNNGWWVGGVDTSNGPLYVYRRRAIITRVNDTIIDLPKRHPVQARLDLTATRDLGKLRSDYEDLEVLYTSLDATPTVKVIGRSVEEDGDELVVTFNLQESLEAETYWYPMPADPSAEDDLYYQYNYHIYYGNPDLVSPPERPDYTEDILPVSVPYNDVSISYTRPQEHWIAGVSSVRHAKVTFEFLGTGVAWVANIGPDKGIGEVQIDDSTWQTVDLYSTTPESGVRVFAIEDLAMEPHRIRCRVSGTQNATSTGSSINVVGFDYRKPVDTIAGFEEIDESLKWS